MKKFFKFITSRMFFIGFVFILQLLILYEVYVLFSDKFIWFYILNIILGLTLVVVIINNDTNPAYKIACVKLHQMDCPIRIRCPVLPSHKRIGATLRHSVETASRFQGQE